MARTADKERVKQWQKRVESADKVYKKWEETYRCATLENYYLGHQWANQTSDLSQQKYVINLCFPSVEIKIPSLLFYRPQVRIEPRPAKTDDPNTNADQRASLLRDTLNTFLDDRSVKFKSQTTLALKEAFPRYGVIEVGYTADFIDNPNAKKPLLHEDGSEMKIGNDPVMNPDRMISRESLFVKRIPSKQFRVSIQGKNELNENDWVGYYEWHHPEDLKKSIRYKNTTTLKATASITQEFSDSTDKSEENERQRGMVKLWKIWDLRGKTRYDFIEGGEKFLLEEEFKFLPLSCLKFHEIWDEFYPLPPMFNWLHPQNELNETREMQRVHRRRFYRRYIRTPALSQEEWNKLEDGGDGVCAEASSTDCIAPIQDAPLDAALTRNLPQSREDFQEIAGSSSESRGVPLADTATQANIIEQHSRIRETYGRLQISLWLEEICLLILMTLKEYMALPFWIKTNVDLQGQGATEETLRVAGLWKEIKASDLGDMNIDVKVDIESLSPLTEDGRRQSWEKVLALILQMPAIGASQILLRKTLSFYDIKSDREVAEIQKAMQAIMLMQAQAAAAKSGGQGASPGPTPDNQGIQAQLQNQMGTVQ